MQDVYDRWIDAIVDDIRHGHAKEPIDQHLMRHATADLQKMGRLEEWNAKHPEQATPCPEEVLLCQ